MSSRADPTSPPPYSFEHRLSRLLHPEWKTYLATGSFKQSLKPRKNQYAADTITAWTFSNTPGESWEFIPRRDVQDGYDAAAVDLRRALDFIIENEYTVYLRDDMDRRQHEYFDHTAHVKVQTAVLRTFALWRSSRGGKHVKPSPEYVREEYEHATVELKILLDWVLGSGSANPVRHSKDVHNFERLERGQLQRSIATRTEIQPLV